MWLLAGVTGISESNDRSLACSAACGLFRTPKLCERASVVRAGDRVVGRVLRLLLVVAVLSNRLRFGRSKWVRVLSVGHFSWPVSPCAGGRVDRPTHDRLRASAERDVTARVQPSLWRIRRITLYARDSNASTRGAQPIFIVGREGKVFKFPFSALVG